MEVQVDGDRERTHLDANTFSLDARRKIQEAIQQQAVLDNLERDHEFLLGGDVFTPDLIETWVELKRAEIDAIRLRPTPHEFELYYDV